MYTHRFILMVPIFLLAACSSPHLDALRKVELPKDPYQATLASQYRVLSESAEGDQRWKAAQLYADKGMAAAYGKDVQPEDPTAWRVQGATLEELTDARMQLISAVNAQAKASSPRAAANAVAFYDCWVENAASGSEDAAICKEGFEEALGALTRPLTPVEGTGVPADVPLSTSFLIFFGWDEAMLNTQAEDAIGKVKAYLATLQKAGYEIVVNGHTDTSGDDSYNLTLSNARADVVKGALVESGIAAEKITTYGFGESDPRVKTPDGVREQANRRVEIFIE